MRPSPKWIASVSTPWRRNSPAHARPSGESGRRADHARAVAELAQRHRNVGFGAADVGVEAGRLQQQLLARRGQPQQNFPEANDLRFMVSNIPRDCEEGACARHCCSRVPAWREHPDVLPADYRALLASDCHRCHAVLARCYRCQNRTGVRADSRGVIAAMAGQIRAIAVALRQSNSAGNPLACGSTVLGSLAGAWRRRPAPAARRRVAGRGGGHRLPGKPERRTGREARRRRRRRRDRRRGHRRLSRI